MTLDPLLLAIIPSTLLSFLDPFLNPIFWPALLSGCLASIVGGVIGSFVVVQRMSSIAGSISHAVLGGVGLCVFLRAEYGLTISPFIGALTFALLAALLLACIQQKTKEREDSLISALWSIGMAIGILFISKTPGYTPELTEYLIGNILWTSERDVWQLALLTLLVALFVRLYFYPLTLMAFDQDEAKLQGVPTILLQSALLALIAITVVILLSVVGAILVMAMLTLPAMTAATCTRRFSSMICMSLLFSLLAFVAGFATAYHLDWPFGATTALWAAAIYGLGQLYSQGITYSRGNKRTQ